MTYLVPVSVRRALIDMHLLLGLKRRQQHEASEACLGMDGHVQVHRALSTGGRSVDKYQTLLACSLRPRRSWNVLAGIP